MSGVKVVVVAPPTRAPAGHRPPQLVHEREKSWPCSLIVIPAVLLLLDVILIVVLSMFVGAPTLSESAVVRSAVDAEPPVLDEVWVSKTVAPPTAAFSR